MVLVRFRRQATGRRYQPWAVHDGGVQSVRSGVERPAEQSVKRGVGTRRWSALIVCGAVGAALALAGAAPTSAATHGTGVSLQAPSLGSSPRATQGVKPAPPRTPTFRLLAIRVDCGATGGRSTTVQAKAISATGYVAATGVAQMRFRVTSKPWRTAKGAGRIVTAYYSTLRKGSAQAQVRVRNAGGWGPWSKVVTRAIVEGKPSLYCGS